MNDKPIKHEDRRREGMIIAPGLLLAKVGIDREDYTIVDNVVSLKPEAFEVVARYFGIKYPKLAEEFRQRGWRWVKEVRNG